MVTTRRTITIEWGACDPAGIVYFPRYFEWFDASTAHLFEHVTGVNKGAMLARYEIAGIPMVDTRARFLVPSTYGDIVTIESSVTSWRRSSFEIQHKLFRGEQLAVEGFETRVWAVRTEHGGIKSAPIPEEILKLFADT
jgi:4-hydroxybenzoyl-CoA thioesterase